MLGLLLSMLMLMCAVVLGVFCCRVLVVLVLAGMVLRQRCAVFRGAPQVLFSEEYREKEMGFSARILHRTRQSEHLQWRRLKPNEPTRHRQLLRTRAWGGWLPEAEAFRPVLVVDALGKGD